MQSPKQTAISRKLRKNMTEAEKILEKILWQKIRNNQIKGQHFRRQVPIGNYIVDFACLKRKLVIELDGGQHGVNNSCDIIRDEYLKSQGFTVIRFWNNDVIENMDGVLEVVGGVFE